MDHRFRQRLLTGVVGGRNIGTVQAGHRGVHSRILAGARRCLGQISATSSAPLDLKFPSGYNRKTGFATVSCHLTIGGVAVDNQVETWHQFPKVVAEQQRTDKEVSMSALLYALQRPIGTAG